MLRRYKKGIALLLLLTFAQEIFGPGTVWALTGGPSQPEVNSFEPVGTNQMVDLATGDFNYNIPLMVVPGPNGGYPINLAYHAGIGMEQEASWVGLGWNINPGAITRNLRGVPDDFSGDEIVERINLKEDITVGVNFRGDQFTTDPATRYTEWFGKDTKGGSPILRTSIYHNNYRGYGYTLVSNPNALKEDISKISGKAVSIVASYSSETGLGFNANIGLGKKMLGEDIFFNERGTSVGIGINSKRGIETIRFAAIWTRFKNVSRNGRSLGTKYQGSSIPAGISFASSSFINSGSFDMKGYSGNHMLTVSKKTGLAPYAKHTQLNMDIIRNKLQSNEINSKTYGYLYSSEATDKKDKLDFNVYNDIPVSKRSVNMGVPVGMNDVYFVSGQGIGGSFKLNRNDIGRYYKPARRSENVSSVWGAEAGVGEIPVLPGYFYVHTGADVPYAPGGHISESGKWSESEYEANNLKLEKYAFQSKSTERPLEEPVYFKFSGEMDAKSLAEWERLNGEKPVAFDLAMYELDPVTSKPFIVGGLHEEPTKKLEHRNESNLDRVKRVNNIQYRIKDELVNQDGASGQVGYLYMSGQYPGYDTPTAIDYSLIDDRETPTEANHHVQEYTVLKPDGSRYVYGLPAYNTIMKECVFANTSTGLDDYADKDLVAYAEADADITNDEGIDNYYSSKEIPSFVHAHMLTQINSADYVDLTGNGPTDDDFGFYAKFNYLEVDEYKWRDPFHSADYIKGNYSNDLDDKASYTYGEKKLYYVHSIETKTHVAVFELGERADGRGVNDEHQVAGEALTGEKQRYLKSIKLYSKNDPSYISNPSTATPIQTVGFEYSYELCSGIFNNDNSDYDHDGDPSTALVNNEGGKLTLKKVWIEHNGNQKGRLSPYEFSYSENPNYSRLNIDRWGNYQESDPADGVYENVINPYTRQSSAYSDREAHAAAWCMDQIVLPSGGTIDVNYEPDDYGYVQDVRATEMVEVLGFSEDDVTTAPLGTDEDRLKLKKRNIRLWFKAEELSGVTDGTERDAIIGDYIDGLTEIYFKIFEKLKLPEDGVTTERAEDYVVGYTKIDATSFGADTDLSKNFGYVDLELSSYKTAGLSAFKTHPFKKAGWQYLRYTRPDLFTNPGDYESFADFTGATIFSAASLLIAQQLEMKADLLLGQYNKYNLFRYCNKMSDDKKSFIRLNSPNHHKYGGGHRIKSVELNDNWVEGARTFGTTYAYENEDGTTSGVADYEPLVGGEENALKKPIWYNGNDQLLDFQHQDVYLETPLTEAVYPSPRVVYGRVVINNLSAAGTDDSQAGITVNEFYTAKDFPVKEDYTSLSRKGFTLPIIVPLGGVTIISNNGYSQGYSVQLNDMSGRPKAVASYPYRDGNVEGEPFSEIKYRYKTDAYGDLDNEVEVATAHGETTRAILGVEQEFSVFEEEHSSQTSTYVTETNLDFVLGTSPITISSVVPSVFPSVNYSQSIYRGISTCKIIRKSGILDEVEAFSDGSTVVTKNLLYDAETGDVLLTSVNNEWDEPVYNYNYAAHWNYENMGGAYKNYRAKLYFEGGSGTYTLYTESGGSVIPAGDILAEGDEITVNDAGTYRTYYVTSFTGSNFNLQAADGAWFPTTSGTIGEVTRSGRRNLQAAKSGTIVSLNTNFLNPLSNTFGAWNEYVTGADPQDGEVTPDYLDLNSNTIETYVWNGAQIFVPNEYNCSNGIYETYRIETNETEYLADKIKLAKNNCVGILQFIDGEGDDTPRELGYIFPVDLGGGSNSYTEQMVDFRIVSEVRDDVTGALEQVKFEYVPTGEVFTANWLAEDGTPNTCWGPCLNATILHADAIEYEDDWENGYPYSDVGTPVVDDVLETPVSTSGLNPYRYGKKGIWRAKTTHVYQTDRQQRSDDGKYDRTHVDVDGEYEPWEPYSWEEGDDNPKWDWTSEVTRYNPYGFPIEERSRMSYDPDDSHNETDIYSAQVYGYENSVVVVTSALASYFEIGYTGFEQYDESEDVNGTGHINLTYSGTAFDVVDTKSHTGTNAVLVAGGETLTFESAEFDASSELLQGVAGKTYVVSMWVNVENTGASGKLKILKSDGSALLDEGGDPIVVETSDHGEIIDGWKKLETRFEMPNSGLIKAEYKSTETTYVDDIRIGPFDGGMVTYVYDRKNLWLKAELDGLNYATFYNYDSEGNLVQVKKETEEGIVTVQAGRSNTRQN